jgi:uncharacterized membrane protein (UPF0127 family)
MEVQDKYKLHPTETVIVGGKAYDVEIAETPEKRHEGLSKINKLDEDEGMLFVFDDVQEEVLFTMVDTNIDLDIIFIDEEGTVINVEHAKAHDPEPFEEENVKYVLEVAYRSGVRVGDDFEIEGEDFTDDEKEDLQRMFVLDSQGNVQAKIEGGSRIFSRKSTKRMIKAALRAYKSDSDLDYRKVGRIVLKELDAQDGRDPQYTTLPE